MAANSGTGATIGSAARATLTREEARSFYDRFGAKQDQQGFYEDRATRDLVEHADFASARSVVEFGCGTGRFAGELLAHHLGPEARYLALDSSSTMVDLARGRLAAYGERVRVEPTDGSPRVAAADASFDRFVSNYVLDLLSAEDAAAVLAEARRVLTADGALCLVSLTRGVTPVSRLVSRLWESVHGWRPALVGGCRPLELLDLLGADRWRVAYRNVVVPFGVPSEVVVALPARS